MKIKSKPAIIIGAILLLIVALLFGGKQFVYSKIRSAIMKGADSLRNEGYTVSFDSLETSGWRNSIGVRHVDISFPKTTCSDSATRISADRISIEGIGLVSVLLSKKLEIKTVLLKNPFVRYAGVARSGAKRPSQSKPKIKQIQVNHLRLVGATFEVVDSASCKVNKRGSIDVDADAIAVHNPGTTAMKFTVDAFTVNDGMLQLPLKFYTLKLRQLHYSGSSNSLDLDSLKVIPWYDNDTFVKKTGIQTDRIEAVVPSMKVEGLKSVLSGNDTLYAKHATLGFHAQLYRDKRQPGGKKKPKKLIPRLLHDLSLPLQIDSLLISESFISYTEFPVSGKEAGTVTFEKLHAAIGNLSNISKNEMTMKAYARFMGAGDLNADFTFPAKPDNPATIRGAITNLDMTKVNRMLIPAGNVEIKKGMLQAMQFNFEYNEYRSDGQLTMHYTDLEVASLLKNSEDKSENKFVTLILKAFIIKKDMDKDKSKGTILFYHDDSKATFNYWWKSILSGIKSLYNLDKVMDTHHSKKK